MSNIGYGLLPVKGLDNVFKLNALFISAKKMVLILEHVFDLTF